MMNQKCGKVRISKEALLISFKLVLLSRHLLGEINGKLEKSPKDNRIHEGNRTGCHFLLIYLEYLEGTEEKYS